MLIATAQENLNVRQFSTVLSVLRLSSRCPGVIPLVDHFVQTAPKKVSACEAQSFSLNRSPV